MTERLRMPDKFYQPSESELIALALESGAQGDALVQLTGGHHNVVYRYGDTVVRYPKTESGIPSLRAEFDLFVERGGQRLPGAIGYTSVNGTPVALIEFIKGEHRDFNTLTPEEVEELARAIADIHSVTSDHFSATTEQKPTASGTRGDYLWAMVHDSVTGRLLALQNAGTDLSSYPGASSVVAAGLENLDGIITGHPEDFARRTFSLLHRDLNPENVIWGSDGKVTFIDPCPTYGDPLDDINYAITNNGGSAGFQDMLLEAYCRIARCGEIPAAGMAAYTLKNGLDDLTWTIAMAEDHPDKRATYKKLYDARLADLQSLLENG